MLEEKRLKEYIKQNMKKNRPTQKEFRERCDHLRSYISDGVSSGLLTFGTPLPSEAALAKKYRLSRSSVRNILEILERNGILTRVKGVGTVVGKPPSTSRSDCSVAILYSTHNFYEGAGLKTPSGRLVMISEIVSLGLLEAGFKVYNLSEIEANGDSRLILDRLQEIQAKALVMMYFRADYASSLIAEANARGIYVVDVLGLESSNAIASSVNFNDHQIGAVAAKHLIELGHARPICFGACESFPWVRERIEGFRLSCEAAGIKMLNPFFIPGLENVKNGDEWFKVGLKFGALLLDSESCDSVFCVNDALAAGFIEAAEKSGARIPEDISVIGCDDDMLYGNRNMTTVNLNCMQVGKSAASLLVDVLTRPMPGVWPVSLKASPILVARDTAIDRSLKRAVCDGCENTN